MATWTAPAAFVDGTVVKATFMDEQLSSNMAVVSTHTHSGASGQGGSAIGPLVYSDYAAGAAPAPPTNATIVRTYATATSFAFITSATATFLLAEATHEHSIASTQSVPVQGSQGATFAGGAAVVSIIPNFNTASTGTLSSAVSIGGTGSRAVHVAGGGFFSDTNPGTSMIRVELRTDGVISSTSDSTSNDVDGTASGKSAFHSTLLTNVAAGSVTYSITAKRTTLTGTNSGAMFSNWLDIREVRQA